MRADNFAIFRIFIAINYCLVVVYDLIVTVSKTEKSFKSK